MCHHNKKSITWVNALSKNVINFTFPPFLRAKERLLLKSVKNLWNEVVGILTLFSFFTSIMKINDRHVMLWGIKGRIFFGSHRTINDWEIHHTYEHYTRGLMERKRKTLFYGKNRGRAEAKGKRRNNVNTMHVKSVLRKIQKKRVEKFWFNVLHV